MIWMTIVAAAVLPHTAQDRDVAAPAPEPRGMLTGYLKIPDIDGESQRAGPRGNGPIFTRGNVEGAADKDHENWIVIESATFESESKPSRARVGDFAVVKKSDSASAETMSQQRTRGDTTLGDVVIVREMDKSSGQVAVTGKFAGCEVGETVARMELGDGTNEYLLHDVEVVDCGEQVATSGDADDRPTEEVAFYYNKITFSYSKRDMVVKGKKILQN